MRKLSRARCSIHKHRDNLRRIVLLYLRVTCLGGRCERGSKLELSGILRLCDNFRARNFLYEQHSKVLGTYFA